MVARASAEAGVNATYFGKASEPLGILVIGGELISYPIYDRTALVISGSNEPSIDNIYVSAWARAENGAVLEIDGFNQSKSSDHNTIVYTGKFGKRTDTKDISEIVVRKGRVERIDNGDADIPEDGFVISTEKGVPQSTLEAFRPGTKVELNVDLMPYSTSHSHSFKHIIGGGPRLIKGGREYISKKEEKFKNDIALSRAARTAVGITADGKLIFISVDKTSRIKNLNGVTESSGMSLEELSELLRYYGAVEAMNLDGGGSSTMVVSGEVVNTPANGNEIAVSNAIVIRKRVN